MKYILPYRIDHGRQFPLSNTPNGGHIASYVSDEIYARPKLQRTDYLMNCSIIRQPESINLNCLRLYSFETIIQPFRQFISISSSSLEQADKHPFLVPIGDSTSDLVLLR